MVDVVCCDRTGLPSHEIQNGVNVYRTGGLIIGFINRVIQSVLDKTHKRPLNSPCPNDRPMRLGSRSWLRWIHEFTWKKIYWPDYAVLWYFSALRTAKQLLSKHSYDAMISISLPFTGHLVGLAVHRKYPQLHWVMDIGDPFSFMSETPVNNLFLYRKLNKTSEERVLRESNAISVTTKQAMMEYIKHFPENTSKIRVIPPLLSLPSALQCSPQFSSDGKVRLVFVGTLYRKIRNPDSLLALFRLLLKSKLERCLELHFFGVLGDCSACFEPYNELLGKSIFIHGLVSRSAVIHAMQGAQVLINIGNYTGYQLPSKVVEYAGTGKPIINIAHTFSDSSTEFFANYPASLCLIGEVDKWDIEKIVEFIESGQVVENEHLDDWLNSFRIDSIAKSYEELLRPSEVSA